MTISLELAKVAQYVTVNTSSNVVTSNATFAFGIAAGKSSIDTSSIDASYVNGATVDFPNFSGMIIVNNTGSTGQVMMTICGGGSVGILGYSGTGTPHKTGTVSSVGGINGYRWTNDSGATDTFSFVAIKTRSSG
jgi:hypothetical protein